MCRSLISFMPLDRLYFTCLSLSLDLAFSHPVSCVLIGSWMIRFVFPITSTLSNPPGSHAQDYDAPSGCKES
ncbi:hypothetical protein EDC04DRAFT_2671249 [Pisolithus marmoratus]|nr:hypothetical protein EDC04DRAFT_2671249 [Pisolithus marmoratus]